MDAIAELRSVSASVGEAPSQMAQYLAKVRERAYSITDADAEALRAAGFTDDAIFEQTVATAVAEGLRRLDAGLAVLG